MQLTLKYKGRRSGRQGSVVVDVPNDIKKDEIVDLFLDKFGIDYNPSNCSYEYE